MKKCALLLLSLFWSFTGVISQSAPCSLYTGIIYVDDDATGSGDGSSWVNAYNDLQDGIDQAAACNFVDEVWVAAGTYLPTKDPSGNASPANVRTKSFFLLADVVVYGGFDGTETSPADRDITANSSILSGDIGNPGIDNDNAFHVVFTEYAGTQTRLDGFTITKGNANGGTFHNFGGGWYNNSSGGGESSPQIVNCIFDSNKANSGGAMYNNGMFSGVCSPTFSNCSFLNNEAASGGAIYNYSRSSGASNPELVNCIFTENSATLGGAVYNYALATGTTDPQFINCLFFSNDAYVGGALLNQSYSSTSSCSPAIVNCTFSGNNGTLQGGAMSNRSLAFGVCSPQIVNSILWGNSGGMGSEIGNLIATPTISYSIIEGGIPSGTTDDGNNSFSDPLFVDAAGNDYHLQSGSAGNDSGTNSVNGVTIPATDLEGNQRIANGTIDLGVYETPVFDPCNANTGIAYVDIDATGNDNGFDWNNAFTNLQDAIDFVVNCPNATQIWIAEGIYFPTKDEFGNPNPVDNRKKTFFLPDGIEIYGGFDGSESQFSERDLNNNVSALSGDIGVRFDVSDNAYHVILTRDVTLATIVDGVSIQEGNANSTNPNDRSGGGWFNDGASNGGSSNPTIRNCYFVQNLADANGAGFYNDGHSQGSANPEFLNCIFEENHCGVVGGAICNQGTGFGEANASITNCLFEANSSQSGGGAIGNIGTVNGNASPEIVNCIFVFNQSRSGGAVFNSGAGSGNCEALYINSTFAQNIAITQGSAAFNLGPQGNTSPSFINCIFWEDLTFGAGSTIANTLATPFVDHCMFSDSNLPPGTFLGGGIQLNADPLFVIPPGVDVHLSPGSPAIDAGNNTPTGISLPATDFEGNVRIQGSSVDIGAFETSPSKNNTITEKIKDYLPPINLSRIYPNPVGSHFAIIWEAEVEVERAMIQVSDVSGMIVSRKEVNLEPGENGFTPDAFGVTIPGMYFISVKGYSSGQSATFKLIKR